MKRFIFFLFFVFALSEVIIAQYVYYVQDPAYDSIYDSYASDMNLGRDIKRPWATWQKAFHNAQAGDTVYFRGGVWYPKYKSSQGYAVTRIDPEAGYGFNGTHSSPICFFAYPPDYKTGNYPILDCSIASESKTGNNGIGINDATNIKLKGLTVRNVRMLNETHNVTGIGGSNFGTLYFENMTVHNVGGAGMWARGYDTVYFVNCDVYNCCDSLDVSWPGGDGDGIVASSRGEGNDTTYLTVIEGCRVWNVSDDGFDIGSTKQIHVDNCWSFNNGNYGDYSGDGTGYKYAYSRILTDGKRWTRNCISAYNGATGFAEVNLVDEIYGPRMYYYNNSSYKDWNGFGSGPNYYDCGIDPAHDIYRNNIVYAQESNYQCIFAACDYNIPLYITQDHNTWINGAYHRSLDNPKYRLTDEDFENLDVAQLLRLRKPDGSLPDISFLKLAKGSDLIDTGVDVGLPFCGSAPDLGTHEVCSSSVKIITPTEGNVFSRGKEILIQAVVEDAITAINEVIFYIDNKERKLGNGELVSSSLWQFTWKSDTIGYHYLRVVAINDQGDSSTSNRIEILINPSDENLQDDYSVNPNPNYGEFTLVLKEELSESSDIHIIGMDGKIHNDKMTMLKGDKFKVFSHLSYLAPGVYVIKFTNEESRQSLNSPIRFLKL